MKMVVSTIVGLLVCMGFMYFMIPLLATEHTSAGTIFNATDPQINMSYQLGTGFYNVLPWLAIVCAILLIIAYSLRRDLGD